MSGQPSSGIPPLSLPIGDLPMDESTPSTGAPVALGPQAARPSARSLARRERADGANRSVVRSRVRDLNSRTRGVTERIERVQRIYTEEPDREREPAVLHYMKAEETFARENAAMRHQMAVIRERGERVVCRPPGSCRGSAFAHRSPVEPGGFQLAPHRP